MKNWNSIWGLCVLVALSGCADSGPVYTDHKNPEKYAHDVKRVVITQAAEARKAKEPADDLRAIVSELEDHRSRPQGEHGELYAQLFAKASELYQACLEVDGRPSDLTSRLDELVALVQPLPGEVVVVPRD